MFNKIFNIGLPKTGTKSLNKALNILNIQSLHTPRALREKSFEGIYSHDDDVWQASCNFSEHDYPQFDTAYPGSKFILTVREMNSWLKSVEKQFVNQGVGRLPILTEGITWHSPAVMKKLLKRILGREKKNLTMLTRVQVFGTYQFNAERCAFVYQLHYKNALEYFKNRPNDLLIMDITGGDGWEKLCPFLGIEDFSNILFPHVRFAKEK